MRVLIVGCTLLMRFASSHASGPEALPDRQVTYSYSCDDPYVLNLDVRNRGARAIEFPDLPGYFVQLGSYAHTRQGGLRSLPVELVLGSRYVTIKKLKGGESYRMTIDFSPYVAADAGNARGVLMMIEFERRPGWGVPGQRLNLYYPRPKGWLRRDCPVMSGGPGRLLRVDSPPRRPVAKP